MQDKIKNDISADDTIDLHELFSALRANKKLIFTIVSISTLIAIILSFFAMEPVYSVKSMIEIGSIKSDVGIKETYSNSGTNETYIDSVENIEQKLSYIYKTKAKGVKRTLPYLKTIRIPKKSKNILSLEVLSRNNEEGIKYLEDIHDIIIKDSNEKLNIYKMNYSEKITSLVNATKKDKANYKKINSEISAIKKELGAVKKENPALAGILVLEISQKESKLLDIETKILKAEDKINELKLLFSPINIQTTKLIGEIEILENPVKPKKALIVATSFISSLIFAIFLVFALNFFKGVKE